ncbi:hypothetical protein RJ639_014444 [Escallonia herrerae]|uniref:Retrotransposon Copia-like N-terminal domain-containing protein n=1 Tax=Escallonia herrerae TaxID=1293975 RepID=A0AA89AQ74_9ASTE|nr:hypothetical protein RJ639_014444 [Escallonia herrerae]
MAQDDGKDAIQRKTISPYDLTTNDNPRIIITQVQLKGENYDEWARSIRTALRARKKFGFIDGTIKRPDENSSDLEDWWTINSLLMSTCKYGKCTCDLRSVLEKKREEEKVHQFLMGFDETIYGTVRSNLLTQDPLPNLNRVYSTLIQEERVKTIAHEKEERGEAMAFAVQNTAAYRTRGEWKDKNVVCSNCKRSGHESENYFLLVGYPEWWGDHPRGDRKAGGHGRGQQQQKMGHSGSRG